MTDKTKKPRKPRTQAQIDALAKHQFPKSVSGNPGGRPPLDPEIKELMRALTPKALNKAAELMENSPNHMVQAKMVEYILSNFVAKAAIKHEVDHRHTFDFRAALAEEHPAVLEVSVEDQLEEVPEDEQARETPRKD